MHTLGFGCRMLVLKDFPLFFAIIVNIKILILGCFDVIGYPITVVETFSLETHFAFMLTVLTDLPFPLALFPLPADINGAAQQFLAMWTGLPQL